MYHGWAEVDRLARGDRCSTCSGARRLLTAVPGTSWRLFWGKGARSPVPVPVAGPWPGRCSLASASDLARFSEERNRESTESELERKTWQDGASGRKGRGGEDTK